MKTIGDGQFGGGLSFYTQPSGGADMNEAMRIDNNGKVGIGTTTPYTKLSFGNGLGDKIALWEDGTNRYGFGIQTGVLQMYTPSADIAFGSGISSSFTQNVIFKANGNVGIGITNPVSKLDIQGLTNIGNSMNYASFGPSTLHIGGSNSGYTPGSTAPFWVLENSTAYGSAGTPLLEAHIFSDGTNNPELGITTGNRPGFFKLQADWSDLNLIAHDNTIIKNMGGNELMRVNSNGNVSIGTTDPKGYKLAVAGNMIAEQVNVKLQANWPDYVFKRNYNLTSLSDLKTYIDKNNHLPEVPSAQEVADKGLNLGEMNKILVKKVEELTLYLIEKDKEIKALEEKQEQQAKAQNNRLQKLEQQLENLAKNKQQAQF